MPASPSDTVIQAGNGPNSAATIGTGLDDSRRSRKPANTKFKQQQLPAWQPMLTARSVLPFLVAIGVAFIPIGIALYLSASNVTEIRIPYTRCNQFTEQYNGGTHETATCDEVIKEKRQCKCRIPFEIKTDVVGPIFLYYALENFFQNHRKYVKSRDDAQLMGNFQKPDKEANTGPATDCAPFAMANSTWGYVPCGAIANSLFNDTIELTYNGKGETTGVTRVPVGLLRTGIAWPTDKAVKFRNPTKATDAESLERVCRENNLKKPAAWEKNLWQLDTEDFTNNGLQNEDLIVWMRTAAFPSFRKLYRRINHTSTSGTQFSGGLPAGNYTLDIDYKYPVTIFDGQKYVIISSVSWIGGQNPFLGIAYMTVGCTCLVLAAIFFFIHVKWGKKPSEMMNVTAVNHW